MSLNFDYSAVTDKSFIWDENDHMRPETESIIWHTMFLGQSRITEDNYSAFYLRYIMYRQAMDQGEPFFSLKDVKGMIGLHTNASNKTDAAFKKDMIETLVKKSQEVVDREKNALGIL